MFSRQAAGETPTLPEASASEEFAQPFFILHSSFFILHSSFFTLHLKSSVSRRLGHIHTLCGIPLEGLHVVGLCGIVVLPLRAQ